ncbi:unnamed protein product, partial [Strongylus vulgaris]
MSKRANEAASGETKWKKTFIPLLILIIILAVILIFILICCFYLIEADRVIDSRAAVAAAPREEK